MTDQEKKINDIAEALCKRFENFIFNGYRLTYQQQVMCAIECQREVVRKLKQVIDMIEIIEPSLSLNCNEAQQVLTNLENRLV